VDDATSVELFLQLDSNRQFNGTHGNCLKWKTYCSATGWHAYDSYHIETYNI